MALAKNLLAGWLMRPSTGQHVCDRHGGCTAAARHWGRREANGLAGAGAGNGEGQSEHGGLQSSETRVRVTLWRGLRGAARPSKPAECAAPRERPPVNRDFRCKVTAESTVRAPSQKHQESGRVDEDTSRDVGSPTFKVRSGEQSREGERGAEASLPGSLPGSGPPSAHP